MEHREFGNVTIRQAHPLLSNAATVKPVLFLRRCCKFYDPRLRQAVLNAPPAYTAIHLQSDRSEKSLQIRLIKAYATTQNNRSVRFIVCRIL